MRQENGFIQIIIIIALLLVILSLLGVSLSALFDNKLIQDNFGFVGKWIITAWNNYLSEPFNFAFESLKELIKGLRKE
jgi:hypothetical protein